MTFLNFRVVLSLSRSLWLYFNPRRFNRLLSLPLAYYVPEIAKIGCTKLSWPVDHTRESKFLSKHLLVCFLLLGSAALHHVTFREAV